MGAKPSATCPRTGLLLPQPPSISPQRLFITTLGMLLTSLIMIPAVFAGPPFRTDDPEPVEYGHGEFYVANTYSNDRDGRSGTAPHVEANYGVAPDVMLHLIAPFAYNQPTGGSTYYGFGDVELGVKYRFIQETGACPMVGTFPIIHLPTGNSDNGLGNGATQVFLPLWFQKTWGPWQSYGGGGYWINPGTDNKNYWFTGWQVQREIDTWLTIGGEIFNQTPTVMEGNYQTGFNIGAIINFTEDHHFIFSAGTDIWGQNYFSYYAAYLWTWGLMEKQKENGK